MKICFIGCGDIGLRAARLLSADNHQLTGTRRTAGTLPDWLTARYCDVADGDSMAWLESDAPDIIIYSIAAGGFNERAYREAYPRGVKNTLHALGRAVSTLQRFIFVSSTGVYHQNDDSWVDEQSATTPLRFNGQLMLQAEQLVLDCGVGTSVRFSGIYGPGRLRMINRVASGNLTAVDDDKLTNRIHVDDCAAVLAHIAGLCEQKNVADCYLASDCRPAGSVEVEQFIASELGLETTTHSRRADSERPDSNQRIAGSKRCSNRRLIESGYQFRYPDYRSGYRDLIASLRNRS